MPVPRWHRQSNLIVAVLALVGGALCACKPTSPGQEQQQARAVNELNVRPRLPTGAQLDPAGSQFDAGSMPLAMTLSPEGDRIVLLLNGWREQGLQVLDRATGRVLATVKQPAAFLGLAFSPDGRTLYASGGNQDVIYRYAWTDRTPVLRDSVVLGVKEPRRPGRYYPAGLATSRDGKTLYVAENLADSMAVVDVESARVVRRFPAGRYPYGVVVGPDGRVYVSAWGGTTLARFRPTDAGDLAPDGWLTVGRHPSAMLFNADGSRLFVASASTDRVIVIDPKSGRAIAQLLDAPPAGPAEGSTPNALALSADGRRLYIAEADNNAVALFDLSAATSGLPNATGNDKLAGRVPTGWYPTAVIARGDTLLVANGKGRGTRPNRDYPHPGTGVHTTRPMMYTLGQLSGTVSVGLDARATGAELAQLSGRVERANGWRDVTRQFAYPPITHVIYIIKENRTYDQVLGDLPQGDGDTSLVYFPRPNSPNHHALAERFGLFDRFFVNAEVSPDGHNWSMAAYATDYLEKTVPSNYSTRGRTYDYEGTNRGKLPTGDDDDVAEPASGYLWDLAQRKGITFRNFGEFVVPDRAAGADRMPAGYKGNKPFLAAHTVREYPGFDLDITDQHRADVWLAEFSRYEQQGEMPALQIVRLPNDHTAGAKGGAPTPRAYVADNDLALGRMIEALSRSRFWSGTAVFVLEDDAQNGPDHVDAHRSVLFVISPYARGGVHHRFTNTTDVLATIEELLGLNALSQFDHYGRPLRDIWSRDPDVRPYAMLTPSVLLTETNRQTGAAARESAKLALDFEDVADEDTFNRVLWRTIKGDRAPYPGPTRMPSLEYLRSR